MIGWPPYVGLKSEFGRILNMECDSNVEFDSQLGFDSQHGIWFGPGQFYWEEEEDYQAFIWAKTATDHFVSRLKGASTIKAWLVLNVFNV